MGWVRIADQHVVQVSFTTDGCGSSRAARQHGHRTGHRHADQASGSTSNSRMCSAAGRPCRSEHCALLAANTLKAAIRDYQQRKPAAQQCEECHDGGVLVETGRS